MSANFSDFMFAFDASLATSISYTEIEQRLQNIVICFNASWMPAHIAMQIAKGLASGRDRVAFAVRVTEDHMSFIVDGMTIHASFNEDYQGPKNNVPDAHYFVHIV